MVLNGRQQKKLAWRRKPARYDNNSGENAAQNVTMMRLIKRPINIPSMRAASCMLHRFREKEECEETHTVNFVES